MGGDASPRSAAMRRSAPIRVARAARCGPWRRAMWSSAVGALPRLPGLPRESGQFAGAHRARRSAHRGDSGKNGIPSDTAVRTVDQRRSATAPRPLPQFARRLADDSPVVTTSPSSRPLPRPEPETGGAEHDFSRSRNCLDAKCACDSWPAITPTWRDTTRSATDFTSAGVARPALSQTVAASGSIVAAACSIGRGAIRRQRMACEKGRRPGTGKPSSWYADLCCARWDPSDRRAPRGASRRARFIPTGA